ncbi:MAG: ferritin family protein [Thermoplasmata archaeon]
MDLSKYSMDDLLLAAIKSEVSANEVYVILAEGVKNAFLKDKLSFLSGEEKKHQEKLESIYRENFPGKEVVLPEESPVPLPEIMFPDEGVPLSQILDSAMKAEMAANEFYKSLSGLFEDPNTKATLIYLAAMEMGHYKLLEIEKEYAERFEDFDEYVPMMHEGP